MSILIDERTQVLVQGITGRLGREHAKFMKEYGTKVVAGVTPGKGGQTVHDVPVYDTVREASGNHRLDASLVLVPPAFAKDAILESINNDIPLIVMVPEHIPVQDMIRAKKAALGRDARLVGPNTIGVISPGKAKVGIMPGSLYSRGSVGIVSRSGTLTHETASNLSVASIGQSTCVGIGGDAVMGAGFLEILELFQRDDETEVVVLIGEIGGSAEEEVADFLRQTDYPKPVVAFIAGTTAPPEKRLGHAGAIIEKGCGDAQSKVTRLKEADVPVARNMTELVTLVRSAVSCCR